MKRLTIGDYVQEGTHGPLMQVLALLDSGLALCKELVSGVLKWVQTGVLMLAFGLGVCHAQVHEPDETPPQKAGVEHVIQNINSSGSSIAIEDEIMPQTMISQPVGGRAILPFTSLGLCQAGQWWMKSCRREGVGFRNR
jgi:hypothetical protein